jgi:hypothetical protein
MSQDAFYDTSSVVISNGASVASAPYALNGEHLVGIVMPATWDAAVLTFQASMDGTNFANAYDNNGNEITVQAAASRWIEIPPGLLAAAKGIKVRSGTSGTPVTQTSAGNRALTMIARRYR